MNRSHPANQILVDRTPSVVSAMELALVSAFPITLAIPISPVDLNAYVIPTVHRIRRVNNRSVAIPALALVAQMPTAG